MREVSREEPPMIPKNVISQVLQVPEGMESDRNQSRVVFGAFFLETM